VIGVLGAVVAWLVGVLSVVGLALYFMLGMAGATDLLLDNAPG